MLAETGKRKEMTKAYEPSDPMQIIGVEVPSQSEEELKDMALCFAEEFIREGYSKEKLYQLFKNPFYQGLHRIWQKKGDQFVLSVIDEAVKSWCPWKN